MPKLQKYILKKLVRIKNTMQMRELGQSDHSDYA